METIFFQSWLPRNYNALLKITRTHDIRIFIILENVFGSAINPRLNNNSGTRREHIVRTVACDIVPLLLLGFRSVGYFKITRRDCCSKTYCRQRRRGIQQTTGFKITSCFVFHSKIVSEIRQHSNSLGNNGRVQSALCASSLCVYASYERER